MARPIHSGFVNVYNNPRGADNVALFRREREESRVSNDQSPQLSAEAAAVAATANDVRDAVRILRKQPDGLSLAEAMDAFKKRILDPQKVATYQHWGLVQRGGDRLSLTLLGWELARRLEPEVQVFRAVLESTAPCRSALEWMCGDQLDCVTHLEVIAYWKKQPAAVAPPGRGNVTRADAISFFHLCQAADLGTVTLGKRGQPTRLLIDRTELERYLKADTPSPAMQTAEDAGAAKPFTQNKPGEESSQAEQPRVFISCASNSPVVEQVQATLALAGFDGRLAERSETDARSLAAVMRPALTGSVAGIIVVGADDCRKDEAGACRLDESVMMIIGAACALFGDRVVLLWEKSIPVPDNLIHLRRGDFEGGGLSWESGLRLVQALKEWKNDE
ncbi:MAG TPA: hypothetical protein VFD58_30185 [Blastocatellia bacterium]|nr:hypothetical protein [Blastocatellia bacterium]